MLLHAALGFHAATIGETSREAKNQWGMLAYVAEGLDQLRTLEPFEVEIHVGRLEQPDQGDQLDREVIRCSATNVAIATSSRVRH